MVILNTPQNPQPLEVQAQVSATAHTFPKITENLWMHIKKTSACKTTQEPQRATPTHLTNKNG